MKVFNTYVQFCGLAYWGPTGGLPAQKQTQKEESTKAGNGSTSQ
jgi:hypothetical protein